MFHFISHICKHIDIINIKLIVFFMPKYLKNYIFFQVISQLDEEEEAFKETDVDGTAAPDIIPHSSKFHIPFFIFIIREEHNSSLF